MGPLLDPLSHFLLLLTLLLQVWSYHPYAEMVSSISNEGSNPACNLYAGSWVYDESYPLFSSKDYFFVPDNRKCSNRKDTSYLHYRWQPTNCNLPKFEAGKFLEEYRGKMVMFVGDSLAEIQWMSLAGLIQAYDPNATCVRTVYGKIYFTLYFEKYKLSLAYEQNRYLALLDGQKLRLDTISPASLAMWKDAHMIVFNTFHWYTHSTNLEWKSVEENNTVYPTMVPMKALTIALNHWGSVVDEEIDHKKTRVFFLGITAVHPGCTKYTTPISESSLADHTDSYIADGEEIIENELRQMKSEVTLLDITLLTRLRPDGHPGMYNGALDCSHYCVPGVPEAWNQLLYAELFPNY